MTIDYPSPVGGRVRRNGDQPDAYRAEVAPNRTFAFCTSSRRWSSAGWRKAARWRTPSCSAPTGRLAPLRSPTEAARHKILDLVGDFALLGAYPQCEVIAIKSGHKLHCTAVRELLRPAAAKPPPFPPRLE